MDVVQGGRGLVKNDSRSESLGGWMMLIFIKIEGTGTRSFLGEYQKFSVELAYSEALA